MLRDQRTSAVERLAAQISAALPAGYSVVVGGLYQPVDGWPQFVVGFDVMVVYRDAKWNTLGSAVLDPLTPPITAIDVVARESLVRCLVNKTDLLNQAGLREYAVYDPTAEILRPSFQAFRKCDGGMRPVRSALSGVFFTSAGVALDARGEAVTAFACGSTSIEEELFAVQLLRSEVARSGGQAVALAKMDADIWELEARLARTAARGSS